MRFFTVSFIITFAALAVAFWWGSWHGLMICALLTLMEVSFSFDNAVVNAAVLKHMDEKWQRRFLTWGILIAVFGMRLLFPILIVAFATGLHLWEVGVLAIERPDEYSEHVLESHVQIGAFGGMFLLMVFLHFILDEGKEIHWIAGIERRLALLGKLESVGVIIALITLLIVQAFLPEEERLHAMVAGSVGIILYVAVTSVTAMISGGDHKSDAAHAVGYSGMMGFIYLQFLDASFSLDGVIGAFAISKDIVIIMLGLGAGAMFVRSLTIYLVRKGTLDQYVFLEHGAHYGIAALAAIMLVGMVVPVPEIITGLVGMTFIGLSLWSSVRYNRKLLQGGDK
jgi:uncharacterized protein